MKSDILITANNSHQVLRTEEDIVKISGKNKSAAIVVDPPSEDMISHKFTSSNGAPTAVRDITSRRESNNSPRVKALYAGPVQSEKLANEAKMRQQALDQHR